MAARNLFSLLTTNENISNKPNSSYQLAGSDRVIPSHDDLKRKVYEFKTKLNEIERLYQNKGIDNCSQVQLYTPDSEKDGSAKTENKNNKENHAVERTMRSPTRVAKKEKNYERVRPLPERRNVSRIPKHRSHRRSRSDMTFNISFKRKEEGTLF